MLSDIKHNNGKRILHFKEVKVKRENIASGRKNFVSSPSPFNCISIMTTRRRLTLKANSEDRNRILLFSLAKFREWLVDLDSQDSQISLIETRYVNSLKRLLAVILPNQTHKLKNPRFSTFASILLLESENLVILTGTSTLEKSLDLYGTLELFWMDKWMINAEGEEPPQSLKRLDREKLRMGLKVRVYDFLEDGQPIPTPSAPEIFSAHGRKRAWSYSNKMLNSTRIPQCCLRHLQTPKDPKASINSRSISRRQQRRLYHLFYQSLMSISF